MNFEINTELWGGRNIKNIAVQVNHFNGDNRWDDTTAVKSCHKQGYGFEYQGISTENYRSWGQPVRQASNIKTVMKHINESIKRAFSSNDYEINEAKESDKHLKEAIAKKEAFNQLCLAEATRLEELLGKSDFSFIKVKRDDNGVVDSTSSHMVTFYVSPEFAMPNKALEYLVPFEGHYMVQVSLSKVHNNPEQVNRDLKTNVLSVCVTDMSLDSQSVKYTETKCDAELLVQAIVSCISKRNAVRRAWDEMVRVSEDAQAVSGTFKKVTAKKVKKSDGGVVDRPNRASGGMSEIALEQDNDSYYM